MQKEIISRQRDAMAEAGLDALVAMSPENFAYTAGFVVRPLSTTSARRA